MKQMLALALPVLLASCAQSQKCALLNEVARDQEAIRQIEEWVDQEQKRGFFAEKNAISSQMVRPGRYSVPVPRDLQWSPAVEARVLTEPDGTPKAVFLGEHDLQGIVVNFELDGGNSLLPSDKLEPITLRTSLICIQRD